MGEIKERFGDDFFRLRWHLRDYGGPDPSSFRPILPTAQNGEGSRAVTD